MADVRPIPEGCHTLTPHLVVKGAAQAIEFYKKAFEAIEIFRMPMPETGLIMHAELQVGDSRLYLCDEMPMTDKWRAPQSLGGTSVTVHVWTQDADALYQRAVDAGATPSMPLMDAFWGDRYGKVTDPFGHEWSIATHIKDLTPEQMAQAAGEVFGKSGI